MIRGKPCFHRDKGFALVAVLWMVAALTLMVASISYSVRGETSRTAASRQSVILGAIAIAAINITLQEMLSSSKPIIHLSYKDIYYQEKLIRIEILPVNGLIDINNASESMLSRLISIQGGIDPDRALNLSRSIIEIRSIKDLKGHKRGFESVEDLLHVPGIDYTLYAKIKDLVSVDLSGTRSGRVNALAAPQGVLNVLTGGNIEQAARIASERDAGRVGIDTTMLSTSDLETTSIDRYRISACVPTSTEMKLWASQTIDIAPGKLSRSPWRIFNAERLLKPACHNRMS